MSSGIYSALSGAITRMENMNTISDNLGNARTAGFKKGQTAFEATLNEARARVSGQGMNFSKIKEGFTDFGQGTASPTGNPLDLAISGEGFFHVRDAAGNDYYTRNGNMRMAPDGRLMTVSGMVVLDDGGKPIVLTTSNAVIDEKGAIAEGGNGAKIALMTFADDAQLQRRSGNLFYPADGAQPAPAQDAKVLQGQVEESNVNMMQETAFMIDSLRAFEACQGALKTWHELAGKANELGVVR